MRLKQAITFGLLGNVLEWYDFSIYIVLAPIIGKVFFHVSDLQHSLFITLLFFSISYLVRPLGSFIFGYLGDTFGCPFSFKLSLFLMGLPTLFIAILPTYATIGVWATIGLISCRLIQGIGAGGELPLSACYIYENAKVEQRRFFCSFVAASSMFGFLLGSITATFLSSIVSAQFLLTFGWRIPFIIGSSIAVFLYYIRNNLDDVCRNEKITAYRKVLQHRSSFLIIIGLCAFISVTFYTTFIWLPSYLHVYLAFPLRESFYVGTFGLTSLIFFTVLFGYVGKRLSENTCVWVSIVTTLFLLYPFFFACQMKLTPLIYGVLFGISMALGLMDSVIFSLIASLFNRQIRCLGVSIGFTLANALFGGMAPTVCSYFINKTGWLTTPVIVTMIATILGLVASCYLKRRRATLLLHE